MHPRSLEIFEALGIVDRFLAEGVKVRAARFHSGGEAIGELDFELNGSRYGFDLGLSEQVTEAHLTELLDAQGGSVTRSTRLTGLVAERDAAAATLERGGARRDVAVDWVVGCDGLRSLVREAAGIEFPGADIGDRWAVFDSTIDGWKDEYDVLSAHLDGLPVILTPLPVRRWRVYLRPTSDTSDLLAEAGEVIGRHAPGAVFADVENPARFRCHPRVAERLRSGRVLLAGDAAHACTPAEGHGMNTGIQDAFNLGWKLALVCRGEADAGLLDTYEAERKPVAERIVSSGADVEAAHGLRHPGDRAARNADLRRTLADAESNHHEAVALAELDRRSPVSGRWRATRAPIRDRACCFPTPRPSSPTATRGRSTSSPTERASRCSSSAPACGPGPGRHGRGPRGAHRRGGRCGRRPLRAAGRPGHRRIDGSAAAQLGVVELTVLGVRPDRYIGVRDDDGDPNAVEAYLDALLGRLTDRG